jgi:putative oxidoreductase
MDRVSDALLLVGRLLMAALFLPSGIGKAMNFAPFASSLADNGLPYAEAWAAAAVAIEILGPIALILGLLPSWTALVLVAFVAVASAMSHRYWELAEEAAHRSQEFNFFKNLGIMAGLLFYSQSGAGAWSISGRNASEPAAAPGEPKAPQATQPPQAAQEPQTPQTA